MLGIYCAHSLIDLRLIHFSSVLPCSEAEEALERETHAAIVIQKHWRAYVTRKYHKYLNNQAVTIQRIWRGHEARRLFKFAKRQRQLVLEEQYYNYMATQIQRIWRGYVSRSLRGIPKHNYARRKQLIQQASEAGDTLLQESESYNNALSSQVAVQQQLQAAARFRELSKKFHHLAGTASVPSVFQSPYGPEYSATVGGVSVDKVLRTIGKDIAKERIAATSPLARTQLVSMHNRRGQSNASATATAAGTAVPAAVPPSIASLTLATANGTSASASASASTSSASGRRISKSLRDVVGASPASTVTAAGPLSRQQQQQHPIALPPVASTSSTSNAKLAVPAVPAAPVKPSSVPSFLPPISSTYTPSFSSASMSTSTSTLAGAGVATTSGRRFPGAPSTNKRGSIADLSSSYQVVAPMSDGTSSSSSTATAGADPLARTMASRQPVAVPLYR